jgi:hypothetical protein
VGLAAYIRRSRAASVLARTPEAQTISVPAPMGSINTISSGAAMPAADCLSRWNLIPAEYGLRTRLGWREWCTNLNGEVRSIVPFTGSQPSNDHLFACTETGIWDVTASSSAPSQVLAFPAQSPTSGHGVSTVLVTAAGHFLVYCDEANGAYIYTESTATWTQLDVTGVSAADLVHVVSWKSRLWFTERNGGKGWYLATNAIAGAATSYNFGAHFRAGGFLVGLYAWTKEAGAGMDDSLVAISSAGDVNLYQGYDPATLGAFALTGQMFAGAVPSGRSLGIQLGGELSIMTVAGLLPMSRLVLTSVQGDRTQYDTSKIGNLWNKTMLTRSSVLGWKAVLHPQDASLIVIAPVAAGQPSEQFAMSVMTKGWSQYRDTTMGVSAAPWGGTLYFGTADGKVKAMDGYVDGVTLADPNSSSAITWALLTGFTNLGTTKNKRLLWVRTAFQNDSAPPSFAIEARIDWNMAEVLSSPNAAAGTQAAWDAAVWDATTWGSEYGPSASIRGLNGIGSRVALAIRGQSTGRTVLNEFEVAYDIGGQL